MIFEPLSIAGAYRVRSATHEDGRGAFTRIFCAETFRNQGLEADFVQRSVSTNRLAGTVRGLHFQAAPHAETKLVRCLRGALFDVIADLRPDSPTFRRVCTVELTGESLDAVYIPAGCAHGFQTLADDTHLLYDLTPAYVAEAARGLRWDDPDLAVPWPLAITALSERDRAWPLLKDIA